MRGAANSCRTGRGGGPPHHECSPLFHYELPVQTAGGCHEWENPRSQWGGLLILLLSFLIIVDASSAGRPRDPRQVERYVRLFPRTLMEWRAFMGSLFYRSVPPRLAWGGGKGRQPPLSLVQDRTCGPTLDMCSQQPVVNVGGVIWSSLLCPTPL